MQCYTYKVYITNVVPSYKQFTKTCNNILRIFCQLQILDQPRTPLIIEAYRMKRAAGVSEIEEVVTRLDENLFTENLYHMKKTKFENEQQFKVELQNYTLVLYKSEFIPGSQPKSKQQTSLVARCRGQRLRSSYQLPLLCHYS